MDDESLNHRSWLMSRVRSKDTTPELRVRSLVHRAGYRYRLHVNGMPGKPDLVLPRYRTAILVHGCYWHRHPGCKQATMPKTNVEYWEKKFESNLARDKRDQKALIQGGWKVLVIWECQTRNLQKLEALLLATLPPRR